MKKPTNYTVFAVDFDGTCVTHEFPQVGKDIDAAPVLQSLIKNGHKIVLNTMRDKEYLEQAVQWFVDNNIELYGANENPTQKNWTTSPKVYGKVYIDDAALGCPLIHPESGRPYVDWKSVNEILIQEGYIK